MNTETFEKNLAMLNEQQKKAVETIYGPVLVLAGPGSGKTQLLSTRVAYILSQSDYFAENILCLTFTDNAAKNMRKRLASIIGQDAYKVHITTFHSFGNEIIQNFRAFSGSYSEAETLDDLTASSILDEMLESLPWNHPYKPGFRAAEIIREVLSDIGDLKKSGLTSEKYHEILDANAETLKLTEKYIAQAIEQIDALGRTKIDGEKKIEIFQKLEADIQILSQGYPARLHGYDSFFRVLHDSLSEARNLIEESRSTKHLTEWKNTWTEKNLKGERKLKEVAKLEKQYALCEIYALYQETLKKRGYIDFSDMILEALRLLENHEMIRMSLAERYQIIMIDEFQDTNEAQMSLIHHIAGVDSESPNIFAVGDDDQSIYKFQGANTKNIRDFYEFYPDTELIILEKNYRSKQEIIDTSRSLLSENHHIGNIFPGREKYFYAEKGTGGKVEKHHFNSELEELSYIASDIEKKIQSGVLPQEIALITKKNKSLELLAKSLLNKNIPVAVSKEESLFEVEEIRLLIAILKVLANIDDAYYFENAELLLEVLSHPAFGIHRLVLWELSKTLYHARSETTRSLIEQLRTHENINLRDIGYFFMELAQRSRYERLEDIIDYISGGNSFAYEDEYGEESQREDFQISLFGNETKQYISPYFNYFFAHTSETNDMNYARSLSHIKKFVDIVRSYKSNKEFLHLSDALEILTLIEKYNLHIGASSLIGNEGSSVQCITVHKAKGLEWKYVYVPFLTGSEYKQGRFGSSSFPKNLPLQAEKDNIEDIERLVYTAATRAEQELILSWSEKNMQEKALEALPNIGAQQDDWEDMNIQTVHIPEVNQTLSQSLNEITKLPYIGEEEDFLRERIEKGFTMNVSALQNFLDLSVGGPESFVKRSLLRFPQAKNIAASYGSAIHNALEVFFRDYDEKKSFSQELLFESFQKSLKKEGFEKKVFEDYLQRGKENLELLYGEITSQSYEKIFLEYNFSRDGGVWLPREGNEAVQITGKIDRVELLSDESLIITDYKTGSGFQSFDYKGADYMKIKQWKYHLQLSFYSILFELSPKFKYYQKKKYELFFVERDKKTGDFYKILEYIQEGEKERTKALIYAVMNKIETLDFPDISHYPATYDGIRAFEEDLIAGNI